MLTSMNLIQLVNSTNQVLPQPTTTTVSPLKSLLLLELLWPLPSATATATTKMSRLGHTFHGTIHAADEKVNEHAVGGLSGALSQNASTGANQLHKLIKVTATSHRSSLINSQILRKWNTH